MKRFGILAVVMIALVAMAATATLAEGLGDVLNGVQLSVGYIHSLSNGQSGLIGKASIQLVDFKLGKATATVNADALVVSTESQPAFGAGASLTIKDAVKGLNFGIGWCPVYKLSYNVSIVAATW